MSGHQIIVLDSAPRSVTVIPRSRFQRRFKHGGLSEAAPVYSPWRSSFPYLLAPDVSEILVTLGIPNGFDVLATSF